MAHSVTSSGWNFNNSYARLPGAFFTRLNPMPVRAPKLILFNHELAATLGLHAKSLDSDEGAAIFAGNIIPPGAEPLAQAYAGHQFGRFTILGDGRAHLLGEQITQQGERFDIQLKGSGPTPYSRRGDGRAALGPMLREYIISEAMHALGIPTTRSLAVVTTGEDVFRPDPLPGAVLTRVASSHIRVGTFEFAATQSPQSVRHLADHTLQHHYPELVSQPEPYLALLSAVIERQAFLVARWMLVGFVHGVMNTDNMAISGETIDYGPCAFMDRFSLGAVFSSIDTGGRYAFSHQPAIAEWNLTRFAETLLPLLSDDEKRAATKAADALSGFGAALQRHWLAGMRAKLGLVSEDPSDLDLASSLLHWMERHEADYTNTFRALAEPASPLLQNTEFAEWHQRWQRRQPSVKLMQASNPAVIPRNHRVEEALTAAVEHEDMAPIQRLLAALRTPFKESAGNADLREPAPAGGAPYRTFCGT